MFGPIYLIESINGDVLEIVRDTLTSMMPYIHEMLKNAEPDPYTVVNLNQAYENLDIAKENLVISIIAAVSGCLPDSLPPHDGGKHRQPDPRSAVPSADGSGSWSLPGHGHLPVGLQCLLPDWIPYPAAPDTAW